MLDFLEDIFLGLSPQEPFSQEMDVESPHPTQEEEVPGSPGDQVLRDLASEQ